MDEFASRMATQRHVLNIVNNNIASGEELFGLSANAIDRWANNNRIGGDSTIVVLLKHISSELFFMATRSQEPVSEEYELRRGNIIEAVSALENLV